MSDSKHWQAAQTEPVMAAPSISGRVVRCAMQLLWSQLARRTLPEWIRIGLHLPSPQATGAKLVPFG